MSDRGVIVYDLRKEPPEVQNGEFSLQSSMQSLARLEWDDRRQRHFHPADPGVVVKSKLSVSVEESLKLLDGSWLPLPYLRAGSQRRFDQGPTTWSRGRIVKLDVDDDIRGHTHRLTVAFDTNVLNQSEETAYLAPTRADVQTGVTFLLAHRANEMSWFP